MDKLSDVYFPYAYVTDHNQALPCDCEDDSIFHSSRSVYWHYDIWECIGCGLTLTRQDKDGIP